MKKAGDTKKKFHIPLPIKIVLGIILFFILAHFALKLVPVEGLDEFLNQQYSTRFYDRNGKLLHILPLEDGLRKEYYPLKDLPKELVQNFIEEEDSSFYHHPGVNPVAIIRAARQNKDEGRIVSGASTITMQLVRLIQPRTESVSVKLKIKEMFLALVLEAKFSKDKILELYLNNIPFGNLADGVGSAARTFYCCEPKDLTEEQMKTLSKIPRYPSKYAPEKSFEYPSLCPHFINYVKKQYTQKKETIPADLTLSIDSDLVESIEKQMQSRLSEYAKARIHNGALLAINNRTGEIIAWVGNASFLDAEHAGQIDGVLTQRQPGSSMKPFLYAHALESGFEPSMVLPDVQQDFGTNGVYVPFNFNNMFNGPVRMRVALASSLNVPAVYVLQKVGIDSYMNRLYQLGYDSLIGTRDGTGLSLALGASEVSLYEMVHAFSVFPNDGQILKELSFKKSEKNQKTDFKKVYNKDTARIICDFLSDKNARSLGFGEARVFDTSYPSIFKTGTANQFQNIIALGATTEITVGVWMGNYEGDTVINLTGSSIPAMLVREFLDRLTKTYGYSDFPQPELFEKQEICSLSGMRASEICPSKTMEYVLKSKKSSSSTQMCNWHYLRNGKIQIQYPSEYQHWAKSNNMAGTISESRGNLSIKFPRNGAAFLFDPSVPSTFQKLHVIGAGEQSQSVTLFLDGQNMGTVQGLLEWDIPLTRGHHTLVMESDGQRAVSEYTVE